MFGQQKMRTRRQACNGAGQKGLEVVRIEAATKHKKNQYLYRRIDYYEAVGDIICD